MRLTALALVALVAAACGDDADEAPQAAPGTAPQEAVTDTMVRDTLAQDTLDPTAERATGEPASAERPGQPGAEPGAGAATDRRLYTVQVAAFIDAGSAREWEGRLRRQGLPVWTSVAEVGGRTFHRLRVGAAPSVSEAQRLGALLTERYEWPVWVAPLTPAERVPQDAVDQTRRVLEAG